VLFDGRGWGRVAGGLWGAREDVVGRYTLSVCEMNVGEGFMTRRAVALEVICVAQGRVARELFIYICVSVRAGPCFPFSAFPGFRLEVR
jgi:hypothetical protein